MADFKPGEVGGRTMLVAAGKAAWQMAAAAVKTLGAVDKGIVVTKYDHVMGEIPGVVCFEAGHPWFRLRIGFCGYSEGFGTGFGIAGKGYGSFSLLSGGGSALFEQPKVSGEELQRITKQLRPAVCGHWGGDEYHPQTPEQCKGAAASAQACAPAKVFSIVLSDILGIR